MAVREMVKRKPIEYRAAAEPVIRITGNEFPEVDWEFANLFFTPMPQVVVVEMAPIPPSTGLVLIAGTVEKEWRQRPDYGTVLATGKGVDPHQCKPGDHVFVDHAHGKRITGGCFGAYEAKEEIRVYGRMAKSGGHCVVVPWYESVLGKILELPATGERGIKLRPSQRKILIMRDSLHEKSDGGVYLPDSQTSRSTKGTVIAVGPLVGVAVTSQGPQRMHRINRGDRVLYVAQTVKRFNCPGVDDRLLVIVEEDAILSLIEGETLTEEQMDNLPMPQSYHHPFDDLE